MDPVDAATVDPELTPLPPRPSRRRHRGSDDQQQATRPTADLATEEAAKPSVDLVRRSVIAPPIASPLLEAIPRDLTETFHYLIARLELDTDRKLPRRLAIVAATHGEGVSTVARALVAVLASDLDVKVCLIDLHTRPTKPRTRGDGGPPGLYDVLVGGVELKDALIESADPRIVVLDAGACSSLDAQNLARSTSLPAIFEQLDEMVDYVVVDTPPVLVGSEGIALLRHTGGYLMVVRQGVTPVAQVRAAADEIGSLPSIGVILNQCTTKIPKRLQRFFAP